VSALEVIGLSFLVSGVLIIVGVVLNMRQERRRAPPEHIYLWNGIGVPKAVHPYVDFHEGGASMDVTLIEAGLTACAVIVAVYMVTTL
jgi:hypothetical protein